MAGATTVNAPTNENDPRLFAVKPTAPPPEPNARAGGVRQNASPTDEPRINDEALVHTLKLFDARLRMNEDAVANLRQTTPTS
jgi:hypothetical protein